MANFLSTSLKNLFISLGASKTSDNNYAVPLLNASTKEPAGDMTISQLASVLGAVYTNILRQTGINYTFKITKIASAAGFLVVNMGNMLPAVFLFGFIDSDNFSNVFVKQIYKSSNFSTVTFTKDDSGNLYFTSQYGNSRGHCVVSISGLKFDVGAASTKGSETVPIEV